ncbi:hypothetical protein ykris0001_40620 [Yersinia kristensenii ATCC 33638]|nr:hypothetical protein ykris0001_40620 [Yersinia kristensenii ATCC 33638]
MGAIVSAELYDSLIAFSLWLSFISAIIAMFFIDLLFKKVRNFS